MQALDRHLDLLGRRHIDHHHPFADDRVFVLGDLIALRQIRIEIILSIEDGAQIDLGLEAKAGAHRLGHAFRVDDRQHARHGRIDERDMRIGLAAEFGGSAGEQFGSGGDLRMDLDADHDLPIAGGAFDELGGLGMGVHGIALYQWKSAMGPFQLVLARRTSRIALPANRYNITDGDTQSTPPHARPRAILSPRPAAEDADRRWAFRYFHQGPLSKPRLAAGSEMGLASPAASSEKSWSGMRKRGFGFSLKSRSKLLESVTLNAFRSARAKRIVISCQAHHFGGSSILGAACSITDANENKVSSAKGRPMS